MKLKQNFSLFLVVIFFFAGMTACDKGKATNEYTFQSVASLNSVFNSGFVNSYNGVVVARESVKIHKHNNLEIAEILVEQGEAVEKDQVLARYDVDKLGMDIEKEEIEAEKIKSGNLSSEAQISQLQEAKKGASQSEQVEYDLQIEELRLTIAEGEYNLQLKTKEIERLKESQNDSEIKSPIAGTISKINTDNNSTEDPNDYFYASEFNPGEGASAFIEITEAGSFRIKASVNEMNMGELSEGIELDIVKRADGQKFTGTLSSIAYDQATNNSDDQYMGGPFGSEPSIDDLSENMSSTYPFYVEPEEGADLKLGEHVLLSVHSEMDTQYEGLLTIPSDFVEISDDGDFKVYKENNGKAEESKIEGYFSPEGHIFVIEGGLDSEDLIAHPFEVNPPDWEDLPEYDLEDMDEMPLEGFEGDMPVEGFEGDLGDELPEGYEGDMSLEDFEGEMPAETQPSQADDLPKGKNSSENDISIFKEG